MAPQVVLSSLVAVTGRNYGALQFKCMCNDANGNFCGRWLMGGYGKFLWALVGG